MKRAYAPGEILSRKIARIGITDGAWYNLLGNPKNRGVWFVWGNSGNGKTEFVLQLIARLGEIAPTLYVSLEEDMDDEHLHDAIRRNGLDDTNRRIRISQDTIEELSERLARPKSPRVVVVDTIQYWQLTYEAYQELTKRHPAVLFVFISHVSPDGRQPDGKVAMRIKRDSNLRIWIEGYKAFNMGRTAGVTNEYTIWPEGAERYWSERIK